MIALDLTTEDGKLVQISMPENASEVPLNKYIDLDHDYNEIAEWAIEQQEANTLGQNRTYYAYKLGKVLSNFFEVDINDLLNLPASGLVGDDGEVLPNVMKEHLSNIGNKDAKIPESLDSLFTLFEHIKVAVLNYDPKLIGEFEYKGETWKVPEIRVLAYNQLQFPALTVLQAVEALEVRRVSKIVKDSKTVKDDGSAAYTSYLQQMAILCTKKGESFQVEGFNEQVQQRLHHFQGISMDIAMDVIFFSQLILKRFLKKTVTSSFSNPLPQDLELMGSN